MGHSELTQVASQCLHPFQDRLDVVVRVLLAGSRVLVVPGHVAAEHAVQAARHGLADLAGGLQGIRLVGNRLPRDFLRPLVGEAQRAGGDASEHADGSADHCRGEVQPGLHRSLHLLGHGECARGQRGLALHDSGVWNVCRSLRLIDETGRRRRLVLETRGRRGLVDKAGGCRRIHHF